MVKGRVFHGGGEWVSALHVRPGSNLYRWTSRARPIACLTVLVAAAYVEIGRAHV